MCNTVTGEVKRRRGFVLFETLLGGLIALSLIALVFKLSVESNRAKKIVMAQEDVRDIAKVMVSLGRLPWDEANYKAELEKRWVRVYDPWGHYYRMTAAESVGSFEDLCNEVTTGFKVKVPGGRVIENVIYVIWAKIPTLEDEGVSQSVYWKTSGTYLIDIDTVYDIYTLEMHKVLYCKQ